MIVDLSISNFRSFRDEQTLSLVAEQALGKHTGNYTAIEDGRYNILRSATILGANASGKSNFIRAFAALRWMILSSAGRKERSDIPPYEPFRLTAGHEDQPVKMEIEFVVPSGRRYRYELAYGSNKVYEERLYSFARRSRAVVFERGENDTWETMKLGGTYKGGARRFPFFPNATYLSRAGNDASAAPFIREIHYYFQRITYLPAGGALTPGLSIADDKMVNAISSLICLADTGVSRMTVEENDNPQDIKLPEGISESLKESILADNKRQAKYWIKSSDGNLLDFDEDDMSSGTVRLVELLPIVIHAFGEGIPVIIDELDANLHTDIVALLLALFHDSEINRLGAQLIFTTHDTNVLNSNLMRRDQLWLTTKTQGVSTLKSIDEYDRKYVRHDSPFEAFYRDGRLGALPQISIGAVRKTLLDALSNQSDQV